MTDPYCWPGSACLRNLLGIRTEERLRRSEALIVAAREVQLMDTTLPGQYDLEHLKNFHLRLFGDVYDWAGTPRTVDIDKGVPFCHWRYLEDQASARLRELREKDALLVGFNRSHFVGRFAYHYGEINALHPFREGNGRTQRAFLRQLAAAAGWRVDWSLTTKDENDAACRENLTTGRVDRLVALVDAVVRRR